MTLNSTRKVNHFLMNGLNHLRLTLSLRYLLWLARLINQKKPASLILWDKGAGEQGLVKGIWKYAQFGEHCYSTPTIVAWHFQVFGCFPYGISETYSLYLTLQCNYVAESAGQRCYKENHTLKHFKTLKKFFACKECKQRTIAYGKPLPKDPCK